MYLAGLIAQRDLPLRDMLDRYELYIYKQWLRVYMRSKMIKHNKDLFESLDDPLALLDKRDLPIGHLEQLRHRPPIARRSRDAQPLPGHERSQLRSCDPVGMPRVELATDVRDLLLSSSDRLELPHELGGGRLLEEGHLVELRVLRDLPERVALHHGGELAARAHHNRDVETEPISDEAPDVASDLLRGRLAREHDVAALDVGAHVVEALVLEGLAKVRHRDPIARGDVDASQQHDQPGHR